MLIFSYGVPLNGEGNNWKVKTKLVIPSLVKDAVQASIFKDLNTWCKYLQPKLIADVESDFDSDIEIGTYSPMVGRRTITAPILGSALQNPLVDQLMKNISRQNNARQGSQIKIH